ncbi:hypothetical protein D3C72_2250750 [compost metagenome]
MNRCLGYPLSGMARPHEPTASLNESAGVDELFRRYSKTVFARFSLLMAAVAN